MICKVSSDFVQLYILTLALATSSLNLGLFLVEHILRLHH